MLVILVISSHSARVAKGKARTIIRTAIIPKPRTSHASATVHTNPDRNLSSISHSRSAESISSNESLDVNESFNERGILMKNIQEIIQGSIIEVLAVRDRKEKNENFVINLSMILVVEECLANIDTILFSSSSLISSSIMSQYILSH